MFRASKTEQSSFSLKNFRKQMEQGVAVASVLSLAFYCGEAVADNVDEHPAVANDCAAVRSLQGNSETTVIVSGAGAGSMTVSIHGFGSVDGCGGTWTDWLNIGLNGFTGFTGCFALDGSDGDYNGEGLSNNAFGGWYGRPNQHDVTITVPLTFVNGPNTIGTYWTGRNEGTGNEGWCIMSLVVNHPPKVTPPPPLLTATPTPGAPSGPGATVPPQPASTPAPVPLECGVVAGTTPAPVCVNGNCSAPSGFRYQCNSTYDVLTFTWDAHAGAKGYNLRLNFKGNDAATCMDGWYCPGSADENITGTANTSYSFDVIPGAEYKAWIQYVGSDGKESGMQIYDPIVCKAP